MKGSLYLTLVRVRFSPDPRKRRTTRRAHTAGHKVMSVVYAMLGADSIDDCDLLRSGRTRRLLGGWVTALSTLGTFPRAFTFGHVRQLDRVLAESLTQAWRAGASPGQERLVVDVDSFVGEVHGHHKQGARGNLRFSDELIARVARAGAPASSCCAPTPASGT